MSVAWNAPTDEAVRFVGIDVGKFTCVAACHGQNGVFEFVPDAAGIGRFVAHVRGLPGEVRLGLEATGGYEAVLWEALVAAGLDARQLAPGKVHAYARSVGRRAKTDACDAVTIAGYMAAMPEAGRRIEPACVREIKALASKRRQLVEMRKALSCQMSQARHDLVATLNDQMAALLATQIAALEAEIARVIATDAALAETHRLLRSIPGIGAISAFTLLGEMPELGKITSAAAAALAGLAPFARDSGTITGPRFIQGGRRAVREVLYMAAVRMSTTQGPFKAFADRLKARGKPGKKVIIAVARKLVELANLVIARGSEWVPMSAQ
jgi:transposase